MSMTNETSIPSPRRPLKLLVALAAAALGGLSVGCASTPPGPQVRIERPTGIDDYVAGVSALKSGDQDAAISHLRAAVGANPSLRMARKTLGELYLQRKNYEAAVPQLQAATELDPYTVSNHYNLGLSLQVMNRFNESVQAYLAALRLDPQDFASNMNLGLVYFAINQLDSAVVHLERATRINPQNPRGWSNLGVVHEARGNLVIAEACYRRSLEIDPESTSTLMNLASNLIDQGKPIDAVAFARQLVQKRDDAPSWKKLGDAFTLAREWNDALRAYDTAFSRDDSYLPAINGKADMYLARYKAELEMDDTLRQMAVATWRQSLAVNAAQPTVAAAVRRWSNPNALDRR